MLAGAEDQLVGQGEDQAKGVWGREGARARCRVRGQGWRGQGEGVLSSQCRTDKKKFTGDPKYFPPTILYVV